MAVRLHGRSTRSCLPLSPHHLPQRRCTGEKLPTLLTFHKLEEAARHKLIYLVITSLTFAIFQSYPISTHAADPSAKGNSLQATFIFTIWNRLSNTCVMLTTEFGTKTFIFGTEHEITSCTTWLERVSYISDWQVRQRTQ